ncbi:acetyltransferase protein [Haloplasma contractile SSD-17B]|uniref:Acetyltransferase protein n=2 Tax=Haloplasma TaxID=471824 RepID=U2EB59_9MOLU|nr:acetyltransferase protein [Haloplasma contractile SSD-17B]
MNIKLTDFDRNCIDEYVNLFISVFSKEPWNDEWKSTDHAKSYLMEIVKTPGFRGYVAELDNKVVGVIIGHIVKWWQGDEYFIKEFFVETNLQGKRIGKRLDEFMKEKLVSEETETIVLLTERTIKAYEFYNKQRYKTSNDTVFMVHNLKK